MEISLKNLLLAGIGTIAYSYEKSAVLIEDLVQKGELTISQGKELNEELKKKINKEKYGDGTQNPLTAESMREILAGLNLATKQDLEELNQRVSKLENK